MIKHLRLLAVLSVLCLKSSFASHVAGGDIRYECVGQDSFLFTVNFYRDCNGVNVANPESLELECLETGDSYAFPVTLSLMGEVSQLCASAITQSTCNGGTLVGMEWYQGTVLVDFAQHPPHECTSWRVYYAVPSRNPSLNLVAANFEDYYVSALMNNGQSRDCNNSPYFTAQPIPYVCANSQVTYSFGVGEPDGDSLVYSLDTAFGDSAPIVGIQYAAGYSPQVPIPTAVINSATGELTFTAPPLIGGQDNYVVVVTIREYDIATGEFLGSVTRDIQLVVIDCLGNVPPQSVPGGIQNYTGSGAQLDSNSVIVCYGDSFGFELGFIDYDSSGNISADSLEVSSNISTILPGATFSVTQGNPVTVSVVWDVQPVANGYATFNFFVKDNACPVYGTNAYTYDIVIVPSTNLGPDTMMCSEDTLFLDATGGDTFTWSIIPNPPEYGGGTGDPIQVGTNFGCTNCGKPWIQPTQTTTYVVQSNLDAACGNTDTITIEVFDAFPINIQSNSPYCVDDLLDTLQAETPGGLWLGSGIANVNEGIFVPGAVDPGFGKDTTVTILYNIEGVCPNTESVDIIVNGFPDARILTEGPLCVKTDEFQLEGYESGGTWAGQNVTNTGLIDPSAFDAPDVVRVYHTLDKDGCVFTDSADIRIIDLYDSRIDSLPKLCFGDELMIHLNEYERDPYGVWSGSRVSQIPTGSGEYYFNSADLDPGSYTIIYEIEGDCGSQSDTHLVVSPLPDARIFGADSVYCDNITDSIQLETASLRGIWGGDMNELHDGYFIPYEVGEGTYQITYELYDTLTTCYNKEIVNVRIARTPERPKVFGGGPFCQGYELNDLRADGLLSNTFKWFQVRGDSVNGVDSFLLGAGNPFDYGELVDMPTVLYGTQVSKDGCESSAARLVIDVLESPNTDFIADATIGNVPLEVDFTNQTGPLDMDLSYSWQINESEVKFVATEADASDADLTYEFMDIGRYEVTLVADNGYCQDEKTLLVIADRIIDFFVPNVFTPNKDGYNDELSWELDGIDNFSFTVYNRWGTKVYETKDSKGFWDGGDQPSGVYFYLVQGTEQSLAGETVEWRGDVTLIRE